MTKEEAIKVAEAITYADDDCPNCSNSVACRLLIRFPTVDWKAAREWAYEDEKDV